MALVGKRHRNRAAIAGSFEGVKEVRTDCPVSESNQQKDHINQRTGRTRGQAERLRTGFRLKAQGPPQAEEEAPFSDMSAPVTD